MLPRLEEDSGHGAEEDLVGAHLEAICVRALADLLFHAQVGLDILEFLLDVRVVDGKGKEAGQRDGSIAVSVTLDEVTGRFWEDKHARYEDTGPDELDGDGDSVSAIVVAGLGTLVDDGGEEETDGLETTG